VVYNTPKTKIKPKDNVQHNVEPPKYGFIVFFAILSCDTHFKSKLRIKLLLFYCMLYTDCQSSRTAATARDVSFIQITC